MSMKDIDFKGLDAEAIKKEVEGLKKELFNLRLNASTMHVKDHSQFKKLRRKVAQGLTQLRERDNG